MLQSSVQSPKRHNGIRKTLRNRSQQGRSSTGSRASAKSRVATDHGSRSSRPQGCSPSSSRSRVAGGHDSRATCLADAVGDRASKGWSGDEEYWDESRETHAELDGRSMDLYRQARLRLSWAEVEVEVVLVVGRLKLRLGDEEEKREEERRGG